MRVNPFTLPSKYGIQRPRAFKTADRMIRKLHEGKDFKYIHVRSVVINALKLAELYRANRNIVGWAALLHDITAVKFNDTSPQHPLTGAVEAEKYLKRLGFPQRLINSISHCIREHGPDGNPNTTEAKLVRSADSLAPIETFFDLIFTFCARKGKTELGHDYQRGLLEGHAWVGQKLDDLPRKIGDLTLALKLVEEKFNAARHIHSSMSPHLLYHPKSFTPQLIIEAFFEIIYKSCLNEATRYGRYDNRRGLVEGYQVARREIEQAWNYLPMELRPQLEDTYAAAILILNSILPYLKHI